MVIQQKNNMSKIILTSIIATVFGLAALLSMGLSAFAGGSNGFDEFGYNNKARIFNGTGSSWCQGKLKMSEAACDEYMEAYAKDKLIMKWNAAWDTCNEANKTEANNASTCSGATLTNEWNGNVPGGSGDTEHFKAVWSQSCWEEKGPTNGGECIWGQYETIMDQGMSSGVHTVWTKATPTGFGVYKK